MRHDYPATPEGATKQFGKVDASIIRDPSLPPNVKLVYTYLTTFCGKERSAFPSRARIARELGVSVRTVDAANKVAKAAGLFTIGRRATAEDAPDGAEFHQPNVYRVHDFGGGYVTGSGPQRKNCATPHAHDAQPPGADSAHYQDHTSGPVSAQTSTPPGEDDCASVGQKRVSDLMLKKPKRYASLTREQAAQALVAVYAAAVDARGVTVTEEAKDRVGASLKTAFDEGRSHAWVWDGFRRLLDEAWRGESQYPWLVASRPTDTGEWAA